MSRSGKEKKQKKPLFQPDLPTTFFVTLWWESKVAKNHCNDHNFIYCILYRLFIHLQTVYSPFYT
ncbi:hypothetical protein M072_2382 [Bacteroides fragilis str. DS-208]|nr:hypothetical protein M072_2382 [Bacteroides fragilis str. DS-208]